MSRKAVRIFGEKILTNQHFYRGKQDTGRALCHIETDRKIEDLHITNCLNFYNVNPGDSRDPSKRERFLVFQPAAHLLRKLPKWYWNMKYYYNQEGFDCCSNYSIAFHYIRNGNQYRMYFFNYKLQIFGVERRFPPPPKKKNFTEVAKKLKSERFVKSRFRD